VDNDILGKKGQINLGFIVAVVLLIIVIISATMFMLDLIPSYRYRSEQDIMSARANSLSVVMLESDMPPALAYRNLETGELEQGRLDMGSINALGGTSYSNAKQQLGLEDMDFSLYIEHAETGAPMLDFNTGAIPQTGTVVILEKSSVVVDTFVYEVMLEDLPPEIQDLQYTEPWLLDDLLGPATAVDYIPVEVVFTVW
jgi:hypothetical protein